MIEMTLHAVQFGVAEGAAPDGSKIRILRFQEKPGTVESPGTAIPSSAASKTFTRVMRFSFRPQLGYSTMKWIG